MTYSVTPDQIASITDIEVAFATTRLLPAWDKIPNEFKQGNLYTELAQAIFFNVNMPSCGLELHAGVEAEALSRCVRAHLGSFEPKHEHKIAGVGYLISKCCILHPESDD